MGDPIVHLNPNFQNWQGGCSKKVSLIFKNGRNGSGIKWQKLLKFATLSISTYKIYNTVIIRFSRCSLQSTYLILIYHLKMLHNTYIIFCLKNSFSCWSIRFIYYWALKVYVRGAKIKFWQGIFDVKGSYETVLLLSNKAIITKICMDFFGTTSQVSIKFELVLMIRHELRRFLLYCIFRFFIRLSLEITDISIK